MSSERKKPGPSGVYVGDLIAWEHEWYWVFRGLAFGLPARSQMETRWEPVPGPKLLAWGPELKRPRGYEELDKERLAEWDSKPESEKWREVKREVRRRGVSAEPQIWTQIKEAQLPAQIRAACDRSPFWLNPKMHGRVYVNRLRPKAAEFLVAKKYRYPSSNRLSSELKRIIHFSRAMAGIMEGIGAVRAIDLIRLLRHEKGCHCVSCTIERSRAFDKALYKLLRSSNPSK